MYWKTPEAGTFKYTVNHYSAFQSPVSFQVSAQSVKEMGLDRTNCSSITFTLECWASGVWPLVQGFLGAMFRLRAV